MAKKTILGLKAKLYRNSSTYGSPTWVEDKNVKDLSLSIEKSEADVSTRESEWNLVKGAMKAATIEFQKVYDPLDPAWVAYKAAFLAGTTVDCAVMDGDITVEGAQGLRCEYEVLKWSHTQNLEEAVMTEITLKPTRADNDPIWMVVEEE